MHNDRHLTRMAPKERTDSSRKLAKHRSIATGVSLFLRFVDVFCAMDCVYEFLCTGLSPSRRTIDPYGCNAFNATQILVCRLVTSGVF